MPGIGGSFANSNSDCSRIVGFWRLDLDCRGDVRSNGSGLDRENELSIPKHMLTLSMCVQGKVVDMTEENQENKTDGTCKPAECKRLPSVRYWNEDAGIDITIRELGFVITADCESISGDNIKWLRSLITTCQAAIDEYVGQGGEL